MPERDKGPIRLYTLFLHNMIVTMAGRSIINYIVHKILIQTGEREKVAKSIKHRIGDVWKATSQILMGKVIPTSMTG